MTIFDSDHRQPNKSTIDGLNTIATFDGAFVAQAGPSAGQDFRFTMVGKRSANWRYNRLSGQC